MPNAHRHSDSRVCAAKTIVGEQSTVFVNDLLWAVRNDPNSHGGGGLIPGLAPTVFIEDKGVIVIGDNAVPDPFCYIVGPPHCNPVATGGSDDVFAHG